MTLSLAFLAPDIVKAADARARAAGARLNTIKRLVTVFGSAVRRAAATGRLSE
jgi:hypothetical protein